MNSALSSSSLVSSFKFDREQELCAVGVFSFAERRWGSEGIMMGRGNTMKFIIVKFILVERCAVRY